MQMTQLAGILAVMIAVAGCSAHNPFIVKNTTDVTAVSQQKYPSHNKPVFVTQGALPATAKYEVLAELEVGKVWYGRSEKVLLSLADAARGLGADAVVEVKTWHQPAGWSWAAPHGSGKIVKITEPASVDFAKITGTWE